MVVAKCGFGELDSSQPNQPESSPKYFTSCDSRGMLQLNQESVINKGDINTFYRVDKGAPFATGYYAQVKRCKSLANNSYYAAKFCPRKRPGQSVDEECIENLHEIALLSQLQHPYIISFMDAFILEDCAVTIMELAPGGDLQGLIDADLVLLEKDASKYIFQLLEALKYLHERHIAHLDIKPQNLLLMGEFPTCDIKLCDFEISRVIKPGKEVKEILGTPDYVAPEILLYEPLSTSADMWSVGILTYVLLTGFSPFGGDTDQETFRNIVHEPIDFPEELFEDISPSAIDLILKLAVKNAKQRPTPNEMEEHEWLQSFIPEIIPSTPPCEPESEPELTHSTSSINHSGPKKRSPRKTMALSGLSTASAAGRRPSARSILRACKSAYDLNKMGAKTKSRGTLIEKMKMASGDNSVGRSWKLRKNLSKSREQLWESKIQLSKSCEKIHNNLPGSTRWASVANFPSLDLGAVKSSTSQESVISVVSNCTSAATQPEILDWSQQLMMDDLVPTPYSISMPNTPPIPNFDLSAPVNHTNMSSMTGTLDSGLGSGVLPESDFNYPSLVNGTNTEKCTTQNGLLSEPTAQELESQKSVAELIMTFGGRVPNGNTNAKKLDLKNQFEPILEDGSEETTISLGDCSDNNSTSGVSSIIPTTKEPKSAQPESGHFSMNSSSSNEQEPISYRSKGENDTVNKRVSRSSQQIRDEMRAMRISATKNGTNDTQGVVVATRRGSVSPSKLRENGNGSSGLKSILKKSTSHSQPNQSNQSVNNTDSSSSYYTNANNNSHHQYHLHHQLNGNIVGLGNLILPPSSTSSAPSSRRGSIPGNCTRHTISSLAKVPKKSILKNPQNGDIKSNRSSSIDTTSSNPSAVNRKPSGERSSSKSPENIVPTKEIPATDLDRTQKSGSPDTAPRSSTTDHLVENSGVCSTNTSRGVGNKGGKVIPKGLSPRERPSFILLHDVNVKPKVRKPTVVPPPQQPRQRKTSTTISSARAKITNNNPVPTPRAPPKPRTSIREQILQKRIPVKSGAGTRVPSVTLHIAPNKIIHMTETQINKHSPSPPSSPTEEIIINGNKMSIKSSKVNKSEPSFEPAAVAIKIFPPDPAIIPKSSSLLLKGNLSQSQNFEDNNNNDSNNNFGNRSPNCKTENNNPLNFLTINNNNNVNTESNNNNKSPEMRRKVKHDSTTKNNISDKFDKSTWGVVCTGSIGRAMERFETGTIKGKKLRRGSVPDF